MTARGAPVRPAWARAWETESMSWPSMTTAVQPKASNLRA